MIDRVSTLIAICDDCGFRICLSGSLSKKTAREELRHIGWSCGDKSGDICPECRMKRVRGE